MTYSLDNIPRIDGLLYSNDDRKDIAKSLNLKYNVWKHKNGINYHILKYDKDWLSRDSVKTIGLLRSVIFKDNGTIVSFAPPKSLNIDDLTIEKEQEYIAEKYVEGTMINVFYDTESNTWEIATRSNVGGEICFFMEEGFKEENTFKYMFNEVCETIGFNINDLNKSYVYSFVMQHPRNRIVKIIKNMKLYLVDVYEITNGKTINSISTNDISKFNIPENTVNVLQRVSIENDNDLKKCKETYASMSTPYDIVGVVIKNKLGERYKYRNPNYEHVRQLRGNQPKLQFQYLNLRQLPRTDENSKIGKITEYLKYYPEHKVLFNTFRNIIHQYTVELFENYIRCYIKKEKELKHFPDKYKTHMYNIHHNLYLKNLMPEKKYVNKQVVIDYFNTLHPAKQMFVMNYDVRKNYIDNEKEKVMPTTNSDESLEVSI
tara:strand:+ start:116 stop:1408 length:1293 start_codon:yes stop_codon:yes gene_type:complete